MIHINNEALKKAVETKDETRMKMTVHSGVSLTVIDKLISGKPNFRADLAEKLADYFGLDIQIEYTPRKAETAKSGA